MRNHILAAVFALSILSSCSPLYIPNMVNTPMLTQAGEVQLAGSVGLSGTDVQAAAAITDNIGALANYTNSDYGTESGSNSFLQQFGEIGAGFYDRLGQFGRFEIFGGQGFGTLTANHDVERWDFKRMATLNRTFVQPSIGLTSDALDLSFSTRFSYLNVQGGSQSFNNYFLDPTLSLRLGYKNVKLTTQAGLSFQLVDNMDFIDYQPFMFNIGILLYLSRPWDRLNKS